MVFKVNIINNTNDTIYFNIGELYLPKYHPDGIIICLPKTETLYYNAQYPYFYDCSDYFDILLLNNLSLIKTSSGRKLNKDITNSANWKCKNYNKIDSYTALLEVIFEINEEDLE